MRTKIVKTHGGDRSEQILSKCNKGKMNDIYKVEKWEALVKGPNDVTKIR